MRDAKLQAEFQQALLGAQGAALALQERVAALQEENTRLREELRGASRKADLEASLFFARGVYWRRGEKITVAYCQTCWDAKRLLIRLQHHKDYTEGWCTNCVHGFDDVYTGGRPNESDE